MIHNILALILEINNWTDYAWFFDYAWHIDWFTVRVSKSKEEYNELLYQATHYIWKTHWEDILEIEKQLKNFLPLNNEENEKD